MEEIQCYTFSLKNEQLINNYQPVSLLPPIFGKVFEKIIFDNMYRYLDEQFA